MARLAPAVFCCFNPRRFALESQGPGRASSSLHFLEDLDADFVLGRHALQGGEGGDGAQAAALPAPPSPPPRRGTPRAGKGHGRQLLNPAGGCLWEVVTAPEEQLLEPERSWKEAAQARSGPPAPAPCAPTAAASSPGAAGPPPASASSRGSSSLPAARTPADHPPRTRLSEKK